MSPAEILTKRSDKYGIFHIRVKWFYRSLAISSPVVLQYNESCTKTGKLHNINGTIIIQSNFL